MTFMNRNNSSRNIFLPLLLATTLAAGILLGLWLPRHSDMPHQSGIWSRNDKLNSILNLVEENYVDTVNRKDLVEAAIPAMLRKLDPHSVYIPAKDMAKANEPLQGNFEGIGISFNMVNDTILVITTITGGPSEKLGLQPGDKIIYVNDSLVAGKGVKEENVMKMLKGPRGTSVKLRVLRKRQNELLSFNIVRDKIPIYSVDVAYMATPEIGYIKINSFAMTTFDEFMKGLTELKQEGMKKLIVDLRGNSGGIMEAAIQIANQFLKKDQLIVYTKGRTQPRNEARATGKGEFEDGELVILIDEGSASASEILAGAIQDNDRGTIIGRRSFGKGLVQEPVQFTDGSGLRLTIARYYTPTGRSIQKPYKDGFDEYYEDLNTRYFRHEFENSDSIHFDKLLKFTTPGGKVVYGGGGIMPDKFVPYDTSGISNYFLKVRPLIYPFALSYSDKHRDILDKYSNVRELEKYLDRQYILNQFTDYALKNSVRNDAEGLKISAALINIQLKAYIARNILDNKGFYPVWEEADTTLKYTIDYLKKN